MSWKNFQVWVLTKKTISYHLRDLIKKSFFVKFEIFNICSMDEFLQGWVLTYENSKNWCKKTFLNVCQYHFDEILTLKNSMMFTLVKKKFLVSQILKFHEKNFDDLVWLQNAFWLTQMIKSLTKTFLRRYYDIFLMNQYFFWNFSKTIFAMFGLLWTKYPWDEFLWPEKFFHRKVWVLENILDTHLVVISSLDQKL